MRAIRNGYATPLAEVLQALVCTHLIIMLLNMKQLRMDHTPPPGDLPELLQALTKVFGYPYTVGARSQAPENVNSILHSSIYNGQHQPCGGGGIRTPGPGLPINGFQDRRFRPLSHSSRYWATVYIKCRQALHSTILLASSSGLRRRTRLWRVPGISRLWRDKSR